MRDAAPPLPSPPQGSGDVKYHLGMCNEVLRMGADGREQVIKLALVANPSHLEGRQTRTDH